MRKILVIAAHPDDATIGMGGTIAKFIQKRRIDVQVVYMTSGEKYSDSKTREMEAVNALRILGIQGEGLKFLRLPDGKLTNSKKTQSHIKKIIKEVKPWRVYIPCDTEQHRDHRATFKIITTALKKLPYVPTLMYEVWPGMDYVDNKLVEDITEFISSKKAALAQFGSQDLDLIEAYTCFAIFRGIFTGVADYVECFKRYVRN